LLAQDRTVALEIVVVDNNSTDDTRTVIRQFADRSEGRMQYAFEPVQGLSNARNRGIVRSKAPIVAFCDDDVRVAADWAQQIVRAFEAHPDVDYVGGRVLPRWAHPPPRWLTTAHWSPLAVQDYGVRPFISSRDRAVCLVGANLAFRRRVFERVGRFTPELGRIKGGIGSTEDHDMQLRIWRAGMRGLYAPEIVALADVTPDRMVKAYHRRWHRGHGVHCADMRLRELVPSDLGPMSEPQDIVSLFGSPAYVYADLPRFFWRWLRAIVRREDSFFYANKLRHVRSYLRRRRQLHAAASPGATAKEIVAFTAAYALKRRRRRSAHQLS
jgi:glycosyltransferase involved in cell wall biosynthesis